MSNSNIMFLDHITINDCHIKIVRDDIYPFIGGGSKARKAVEYEKILKDGGYNAVVTCGGIQSNHNRAMALMCAKNKWKCHLCIQGSKERFYNEKGNALLDRLSGAICEFINPENTSVAMDNAMLSLSADGYKPYYVTGGGHDLPGGIAYVKAIAELKIKCDEMGYKPDYIFHASGTGSTQAGILVGLDIAGWSDIKVVGISVARTQDRGRKVIAEFANLLAKHYGINKDYTDDVIFNDEYLFGGYEKYSEELSNLLTKTAIDTGIVFDTTYSGKAFYGMLDIIKKNPILRSKNILFWHTGGLMNLMK